MSNLPEKLSAERLYELAAEKNLTLDFYQFEDLVAVSDDHKLDTFKCMYHYPIVNWHMAQVLMYYARVSDIVIGEPFIFERDKIIKNIKHVRPDIQIRYYPTVGQPALLNLIKESTGIEGGWILPQHVNMYDDFVDVLELMDENATRESTILKAYVRGEYLYGLQHLVKNCSSIITCNFVDEGWVEKRLNCRQVCRENKNNCHYCFAQERAYETLLARDKQSN